MRRAGMWWKRRAEDAGAPVSETGLAARRVRGRIGLARRGARARKMGTRRKRLRTISTQTRRTRAAVRRTER